MNPIELRRKARRLEANLGSGHENPKYYGGPLTGKELDGFAERYELGSDGKMRVIRPGEQDSATFS